MEDNSEKTKLKFLNQQIYDYLVSKNLPSTAEEFAKETNLQAQRDVALDDEYLSDFWSLFRDIECSRPGYNPAGNQASTSTPYPSSTPLPPALNPSTSPSRRPNPERGPGSSRSNPMTSRPNLPQDYSLWSEMRSTSYHMKEVNNGQQSPAVNRAFKSQYWYWYEETYSFSANSSCTKNANSRL